MSIIVVGEQSLTPVLRAGRPPIPTLLLGQQFCAYLIQMGGGGHFSSILKEMVNKVFLKTQRSYSGVILIRKFYFLFCNKMDSHFSPFLTFGCK